MNEVDWAGPLPSHGSAFASSQFHFQCYVKMCAQACQIIPVLFFLRGDWNLEVEDAKWNILIFEKLEMTILWTQQVNGPNMALGWMVIGSGQNFLYDLDTNSFPP